MTATIELFDELINDDDSGLFNVPIPDQWRTMIAWDRLEFEQRESIIAIPNYLHGTIVHAKDDVIIIEVLFGELIFYLIDSTGSVIKIGNNFKPKHY